MGNFFLGLLEASIAIIVGVVLYVYAEKTDLAEFVWALGVFLTLHRVLNNYAMQNLSKKYDLSHKPLENLVKIIDLDKDTVVKEIKTIQTLYSSIVEPEFLEIKDAYLNQAKSDLKRLLNDKKTNELSRSPYYSWLNKTFSSTTKGNKIQAVSVMNSLEWDNSPEEKRFIAENIEAASRGVKIQRIFLIKKDNLKNFYNNRAVQEHLKPKNRNLKGYYVVIDHANKVEPSLLEKVSDGFVIVNSRVVLIDLFSPDGDVRGEVSMSQDSLSKYTTLFKNLMRKSIPLNLSNKSIM